MHPRRFLALACLPALLLATACSSDDDKKPDGGDAARIVKFEANPASVRAGESTTLSWITEQVTSIRIEDGSGAPVGLEGAPPAAGSVVVFPVAGAGAKFTLFAKSASGAELRRTVDIQVTVPGGPRIDTFKSDREKIAKGEKATLSWTTTDATHVEIKAGDGSVVVDSADRLDGEQEVEPDSTTVYTLTATGVGDTPVTAVVRVEVEAEGEAPTIVAFTATPTRFDGREEDPVEVSVAWTVSGATSLTIERSPGGEPIVPIGKDLENDEFVFSVTESTTFRLIATNDAGSVEATAAVTKVDPPTVAFHASATQVSAGDEIVLVWNTSDAVLVEILENGAPIPDVLVPFGASGELPVTVDESSTFTLRATNEFGVVVMKDVFVEVGTVKILGVAATPERARAGEAVEIAWTAFGGRRILVRDHAGDAVEGCDFTARADIEAGSCTIVPDAEGTFVYWVELSAGEEMLDAESVDVVVREGAWILEFTATPIVTVGGTTTVTWRTEADLDGNLPTLSLDVAGTDVDLTGEDPLGDSIGITMLDVGTHMLTLTATSPTGTPDEATARVEVVEAATVAITATPAFWAPNSPDPVEVSWTSENAVELELLIEDANGLSSAFKTPSASGTTSYFPVSIPVTYRMIATNAAGDVAVSEATVGAANPTITSFEATETAVGQREAITLSWATTGATSATLEPAHGGTLAPFIDVSSGTNIATFGNDQCGGGDLDGFYGGGCYSHTFANGFTFPFGGSDRTQMWIYNNGAIGFGAKGSGSGINSHLSATPGANSWVSLAPFWNRMALNDSFDARSPSGKIYVGYGTDAERGDYAVVQWKNFWFTTNNDNDSPTNLNFEVVLFADGSFDYRYGTMSSVNRGNDAQGAQAVIGFQTGTSEFAEISYRAVFPGGLSNYGFTFRPAAVETSGSWTVVPLSNTTFVLTASNDVGSDTESIDVTVSP